MCAGAICALANFLSSGCATLGVADLAPPPMSYASVLTGGTSYASAQSTITTAPFRP